MLITYKVETRQGPQVEELDTEATYFEKTVAHAIQVVGESREEYTWHDPSGSSHRNWDNSVSLLSALAEAGMDYFPEPAKKVEQEVRPKRTDRVKDYNAERV